MTLDDIRKEVVKFRQLTEEEPTRIYLGINQQIELKHSGSTLLGMEVFRVQEKNHLFLASNL